MIPYAPISRLVAWLTRNREMAAALVRAWSPLGTRALQVALREVGHGEHGGNNKGPDVSRYRGRLGGRGAWCAAFVVYCFEVASGAQGKPCPIKRTHGARKLYRRCVAAGWRVEFDDIQPGDVVLWARGDEGSWMGHIGIVGDVMRDSYGDIKSWRYVAGNEGKYPAVVRVSQGHSRRLIGFARVM